MAAEWAEIATAKIATVVTDHQIAATAGVGDGVKAGDAGIVYRPVEITDPDTGETLGMVRVPRVRFTVTSVAQKYCLANITDRVQDQSSTNSSMLRVPVMKKLVDDPFAEDGDTVVKMLPGTEIVFRRSPDEPPF